MVNVGSIPTMTAPLFDNLIRLFHHWNNHFITITQDIIMDNNNMVINKDNLKDVKINLVHERKFGRCGIPLLRRYTLHATRLHLYPNQQ